ncbi:hypothetical protein KA005_47085 [bacterium]|nr:hypothetical protein [bacterium]
MHDYITDGELIEVNPIRSKGQVTLVKWDDVGRVKQTLVPRNVVLDGDDGKTYVTEESLDMGIPYGVNWEARMRKSFTITSAKIAEQLEVVGIWTKEDYEQNPSVVQQAVLGAAREILTELYAIVHNIP